MTLPYKVQVLAMDVQMVLRRPNFRFKKEQDSNIVLKLYLF